MSVRRALLTLFLLLPPVAVGGARKPGSNRAAEESYQGARRFYYALKADPARRKLRHNWQNVAGRFEQVAVRFPQSTRAPDALFTAAQLREELSRISMLDTDLEAAVSDYEKLIERHPRHNLADDAALALGKIDAERLGDPDAARKVLAHGLEQNPRGDRARSLKALLSSLGPPAPRPEAKRVIPPTVVVKLDRPEKPERAHPEEREPVRTPARPEPRAPARDSQPQPAPVAGTALAEAGARPGTGEGRAPAVEEIDGAEEQADPDDGADEAPAVAAAPERNPDGGRPQKVSAAQAKARLKNARSQHGEITLAEQLGLKVRRVVIDAGHGGHDSGAVGPTGTLEKDVSLAIARKVGDILATSGLEVMLTRDDDTFVRLEDRARIANEARGDLFISIHCNSARSKKLRGIETYTLNTSSDRYSIRLAARENSSSEKGISDLQFILADLATKANTEESSRLASRVQHNLVSALGGRYKDVKDLGTKEALFYVLLGAKMPSILVETSFISNPEDEKRLGSKSYQEDVAQAVAAGVQDFLGNRQRVAKVD